MLDPLPVLNRAGLSQTLLQPLVAAVARHYSLGTVVDWGLSCVPPRYITDVIVQDEYTHDVVMPWGDALWLVYDTT